MHYHFVTFCSTYAKSAINDSLKCFETLSEFKLNFYRCNYNKTILKNVSVIKVSIKWDNALSNSYRIMSFLITAEMLM